jgi:hypothetical protein
MQRSRKRSGVTSNPMPDYLQPLKLSWHLRCRSRNKSHERRQTHRNMLRRRLQRNAATWRGITMPRSEPLMFPYYPTNARMTLEILPLHYSWNILVLSLSLGPISRHTWTVIPIFLKNLGLLHFILPVTVHKNTPLLFPLSHFPLAQILRSSLENTKLDPFLFNVVQSQ